MLEALSDTPEIRKYKKKFSSDILCAALWGIYTNDTNSSCERLWCLEDEDGIIKFNENFERRLKDCAQFHSKCQHYEMVVLRNVY